MHVHVSLLGVTGDLIWEMLGENPAEIKAMLAGVCSSSLGT